MEGISEDVLRAQSFLGEILQKQFLCKNDEHATEAADMKEDVLKGYLNYTDTTYKFCVQFIDDVVKHGLGSLVKHGLDSISKTWTR